MFDPMWDPPPATFFGIPWEYLILALGAIGMLIGLRWIFRIHADEPQPKSFYATDDRRVGPSIALIVGTALLGAVFLAFGLIFYVSTAPGDGLNPLLTQIGIALGLIAVALAVRRLWGRSRI